MEQPKLDQRILDAMSLYYRDKKLKPAIEKIDLILKENAADMVAYSVKAQILRAANELEEALKVASEGLGHNGKEHTLLKLRAEILCGAPYFNTQEALNCINLAQRYFEASNIHWKSYLESDYEKLEYLTQYVGSKAELKVLESYIRNLGDIIYVLNKTQNIEQQLATERIRTVELLGVFTAILALVFSSVHIATTLALPDALVLLVGVALVLISFLIALHMAFEPLARTRSLVVLLVVLVVVLFGLPWYGKLLHREPPVAQGSLNSNIDTKQ